MAMRCASAPLCAPATRTVSTPASYDADRLVRHDPRALLYAPLRVLVHSDDDGNAVFSIDQPSTAFGSLGIDEVTAVGLSLDRKVAALLRVIGVDPGEAFDS